MGGEAAAGGDRLIGSALVAHELDTGTPVCSAAGVAPEQRGGTHLERMQQHTNLARLGRRAAMPLTLLAASGQGRQLRMLAPYTTRKLPSARSSVLMRQQLLGSRATQCPIALVSKVLSREAARFPGQAHLSRSIARSGCCVPCRRWERRRKFGGAHRVRLQLMPQGEAQVSDPLRDHLPALLPPGQVRAPTVRVLFPILIGERRLKGTAMQIHLDHI